MEELRITLTRLINDSDLTFDAKFYIVKDVFREMNDMYVTYLQQQKQQETAKDEAEQTE